MKRIVYSRVLKFIAVLLFTASIVAGSLIVSAGILWGFDEDEFIYEFESDFSESWFIVQLLSAPENAVYNVYSSSFYDEGISFEYSENDRFLDTEAVEQNLRKKFENFYYSDKINYYIQWNNVVFKNCNVKTAEELMQGEYYSYLKRDSDGNVDRVSSHDQYTYLTEGLGHFDTKSTLVISCNIKDEIVEQYKALWEKQEALLIDTLMRTLACALIALFMLIYLMCVCGKNRYGEYKNMWLDNIWAEIHLAAVGLAGIGTVGICVIVLDEYMSGHFPLNLIAPLIGITTALGSLIVLTSLLSIIRNIKTRRITETSIIIRILKLIFRALRWCFGIIIKAVKWVHSKNKAVWSVIFGMLSKRTGVILITMLFVYTALIGLFGIFAQLSPVWILLGVLLFGAACFVVAHRAKDLDSIKKAVCEIRNGNVSYKISLSELKCDDLKLLAADINDIAKGLDESVAAKLKAERLKTELITNVSHDLKTPITSIISYTELLSKVENLPEEALDYVSVIAKKSDRLKKLTQDLFDISKVQSGNEDVILEKLDVSLLINQSLAEYDNEIKSSELPFCVDLPKELYISADGRKMSRVVSNLISNILKYSMKNTRVFITASETDGNIVMEFKNISAYPLDFDSDEITQRFVRGDESRTAEGNGLGLAIAKSYTEICGGVFEIVVDGDMFKAILKFRKHA